MRFRCCFIGFCMLFLMSISAHSEPLHIEKTLVTDDVEIIVKADAVIPSAQTLPIYTIQIKAIDAERLAGIIWPDRQENISVSHSTEDGSTDITWPEGNNLYVINGMLTYQTPYTLPAYRNPEYYLSGVGLTSDEISLPKDEALDQVRALLACVGIDAPVVVASYSFDKEVLSQLYGDRRKITEKDEGYYFRFHITENDIPILPHIRTSAYHNYFVFGSGFEITVTGRGIQYFSTIAGCSLYDIVAIQESGAPIHTLDEALEVVSAKYSQIILLEPILINDIGLYYVIEPIIRGSEQQYTLTPAWVFYHREFHEESGLWLDADPLCIINAITLKEIF